MIKRHAERDESLDMPFVLRETNYLLNQQCGIVKDEELRMKSFFYYHSDGFSPPRRSWWESYFNLNKRKATYKRVY